jgi:hypothetical protein
MWRTVLKVGAGCVANDEDHQGRSGTPITRAAAGYRSQRPPRLREPAPTARNGAAGKRRDAGDDVGGFGAAPEDGLRMLAALEAMSSLEPDFADELVPEEASITIIEQAEEPAEGGSLQERLEQISAALEIPAQEPEAVAFGGADEATIEIFELGEVASEAEEALARYCQLQRIASGKS